MELGTQDASKSCFNRLDLEIIKSPARRPENLHIVVSRRPNIWIRSTEQENAICAGGRSQMRNSTVVPVEYRSLKHDGKMKELQFLGEMSVAIIPITF